jgi:hypothetical protein
VIYFAMDGGTNLCVAHSYALPLTAVFALVFFWENASTGSSSLTIPNSQPASPHHANPPGGRLPCGVTAAPCER